MSPNGQEYLAGLTLWGQLAGPYEINCFLSFLENFKI